jgi:lysophospholipase L1-like esterase
MLGGSTLWGTGSEDWQTIPSFVAKFLNEQIPLSIVYNYAETGHVSSQELNRLISEIKKGNIPDLVIFYDGINDANSGARMLGALQTPSYHDYMERFERVFKINKFMYFMEILKTTYTYRAFVLLKRKLLPDYEEIWEKTIKEEQKRQSIEKTVKYLVGNYKIASAIGKMYGFEVIVILQPYLNANNKILQNYEKQMLSNGRTVIDDTYAELKKIGRLENPFMTYDLSGIFKTIDDPIYIDWAHIGPQGNYYVAKKIAEIIKNRGN